MTSALEMVESARDRLEANPMDPNTAELVGLLFAKQNVSPAQLQANGQLDKALNVFRNIHNNFRLEVTGGRTILWDDDVVGSKPLTTKKYYS